MQWRACGRLCYRHACVMVSARGPVTPLLEMRHMEVTAPRAVLRVSSIRPLPAARRARHSPSPSWSSGTRSIWRTSEWPLEMGMRVPFGMRVAVLDAWRGRLAKQPGKRFLCDSPKQDAARTPPAGDWPACWTAAPRALLSKTEVQTVGTDNKLDVSPENHVEWRHLQDIRKDGVTETDGGGECACVCV